MRGRYLTECTTSATASHMCSAAIIKSMGMRGQGYDATAPSSTSTTARVTAEESGTGLPGRGDSHKSLEEVLVGLHLRRIERVDASQDSQPMYGGRSRRPVDCCVASLTAVGVLADS